MENNRLNNQSQRGFVKIGAAIIGVLFVITGFLAWQTRSLKQQVAALSQTPAQQTVAPVVPAPVATVPVPAPAPAKPVAVAAAKKPAAKGNYTQPVKEKPALAASAAPAPVSRVVPTDVTPMEPPPFPRNEPYVPSAPAKIRATLAQGTVLTVRLLDTLNTNQNQAGDRFRASLEDPIVFDGNVVIPRGTTIEGRIVDAQQAGRVSGVAQLAVELTQVQLAGGETVVLETDTVRRQGETSTGSDTAKVGTGAAIGAIIGAISGGGKGAAIGAATGAGAGTAGVLLTRGQPLVLSQETVLSFQLNAPLTMEVFPGQTSDMDNSRDNSRPQRAAPSSGDWDRDRPVLRRRLG